MAQETEEIERFRLDPSNRRPLSIGIDVDPDDTVLFKLFISSVPCRLEKEVCMEFSIPYLWMLQLREDVDRAITRIQKAFTKEELFPDFFEE